MNIPVGCDVDDERNLFESFRSLKSGEYLLCPFSEDGISPK